MIRKNRKLLCSTGTMVGSENGYNYRRAINEILKLSENNIIYGAELMMLSYYYDKSEYLIGALKESEIRVPVIHCEKEIGSSISLSAFMAAEGDIDGAENMFQKTVEMFKKNCDIGLKAGAIRMVLHLWGGQKSDINIEYNCEKLSYLVETAKKCGIEILIENVPSVEHDPLSNWHLAMERTNSASFVFDTRFAEFQNQIEQVFSDIEIAGRIKHVHISDYRGKKRDFSSLRPIYHPLDGQIDFTKIAKLLDGIEYVDSITLESPVMVGEKLDISKLCASLEYIRKYFC